MKKISILFFIFACALFSADSAYALTAPVRTRINRETAAKGFTLKSSDYKLKLGITPGALSSEKRIKAFIKQVDKSAYNLEGENLVSKLFAYDFHGATVNKALWLSLKYSKKSKLQERQIKFWDNNQQVWRELPSTDKQKKRRVNSSIHLSYAVVGVFAEEKDYQIGYASWYDYIGAASTKYPYGSIVKVINLENGKSCEVTIKDYGPFVEGRVIDLPREAFGEIADIGQGVVQVKVIPIYIP
jgi:hypothetical protein